MPEDPVTNQPSPGGGTDPTNQPAPAGGDSGSTGGGDGRTLDNVRGELLRKHGQLSDQIAELTKTVGKLVEGFGQRQQQPQAQTTWQQGSPYVPQGQSQVYQPGPVSPFGAPRPLASFTDEQLVNFANGPTATSYQKEAVRVEIEERRQERRFDQMFQMRDREQRVNNLKTQAETAALASFPALRDPASDFSRKVEAELQMQRGLGIPESPYERYDAANRVARAMGLEVSRAVVPGFTAPAAGDRPADTRRDEPQSILSDEAIDQLARRFEHALPIDVKPDGKAVRRKFDKKKLSEAGKQYGQAKSMYHGRGIKVE